MAESEAIRALRRELGRQLAMARAQAGYTQRGFADRIAYARSTVSTVESGIQRAGRSFWEACDRALRTSGTFARGYDRIRARQATALQEAIELSRTTKPQAGLLRATTIADALEACQELGWPTSTNGNIAELVTGTVLDALEVPQAAGTLAAHWWQYTGGAADQVRGLPELPDPQRSLAVIACTGRFFFLATAGAYLWSEHDVTDSHERAEDLPTIAWHSAGSSIPAPPSADNDGRQATWAYLPEGDVQLASPIVLLDLLTKAVDATRHYPHAVSLAGDVLVVPGAQLPV